MTQFGNPPVQPPHHNTSKDLDVYIITSSQKNINWQYKQNGNPKEGHYRHWVSSFPPTFVCLLLTPGCSAGVTGLQTSISLLEAGYRVCIIGKHLPGDESIEYTSPWYISPSRCNNTHSDTNHRAGAHWRSHAPDSDPEQQQWDTETYKRWLDVIEKERLNPGQKSFSGLAVSQKFASSFSLFPRPLSTGSRQYLADIESAPQLSLLQVFVTYNSSIETSLNCL